MQVPQCRCVRQRQVHFGEEMISLSSCAGVENASLKLPRAHKQTMSASAPASASALPASFLESSFRTKAEYEASLLLSTTERAAAERAEAAKVASAERDPMVTLFRGACLSRRPQACARPLGLGSWLNF